MLGSLSIAQMALVAMEVVVISLGLTISYIAYRGYVENSSRPMLFISGGFVLLVGVPAVLAVVTLSTSILSGTASAVVNRLSTVAGMASILYGMRMEPD
jgi:hypothetical protein